MCHSICDLLQHHKASMSWQKTNAADCINQRFFGVEQNFFSEKLMKSLRDTDHSWVVQQFQSGPSAGAVFADVYWHRSAQSQGREFITRCFEWCRDRNEHHLLWMCFLLVRAASLRSGLCIETLIDQYIWYPTTNDLYWCKRAMYS